MAPGAWISVTKASENESMVLNQLPPELEEMVPTFSNAVLKGLFPSCKSEIIHAECPVWARQPPPAKATCTLSAALDGCVGNVGSSVAIASVVGAVSVSTSFSFYNSQFNQKND